MQSTFKIYTKGGDKGTSVLFTGDRLSKANEVFHCLGSIDELNAHLGLAREHYRRMETKQGVELDDHAGQLEEIQARLIDVGSHVATPRKSEEADKKIAHTTFSTSHSSDLESWIDQMDLKLPPLKNFILPSGGLAAS